MKTYIKYLTLLLTASVSCNVFALVTFDGETDDEVIPFSGIGSTFTDGGIQFQMGIVTDFPSWDGSTFNASLLYETAGPVSGGGIATDGFFINTAPNVGEYDLDLDPIHDLGNSFVRTADLNAFGSGVPDQALVIKYTSGVTNQASGEIWDIDSSAAPTSLTEGFIVQAYDSSNNLIATDSYIAAQADGVGDYTLDGKAWVFELDAGLNVIDYIAIRWDPAATKSSGVGLAFNNFNAVAIPEPGTLVLAGILLGSFGGLHLLRRRKKA